jgi:DNA-binding YbaB/EbfC family protein
VIVGSAERTVNESNERQRSEGDVMVGGFGDMSHLLRQAQQMQSRMAKLDADLKERVLEGTAGGGAVKVYVNGALEVVGVKLSKDAVDPEDVETLEDLVQAAVSQALKKAKELKEAEMSKITGGLNLPGISY